ncbi:MAG: LPS translocon maturation chaperone LptM [Thiotrichales bacterium]
MLSLIIMLAGCGQKGALYIPDKPEKTQKQKN